MEKKLICLYVPAISVSYDMFVPMDLPIGELTKILARGVADLNSGSYTVSGRELLCTLNPDRLMRPSCTLQDYGVADGAHLMIL